MHQNGARKLSCFQIVEDGWVYRMAGSVGEIDSRKQLEFTLRDSVEVAEQNSRFKSQFIANMSHELRTPLNAIIGITEMLREDVEEDGLTAFEEPLTRVSRAGKHLLNLINDVLDLSRIEAGKLALYPEHVEIDTLLHDAVTTTEHLIQQNNNRIHLEVAEAMESILPDSTPGLAGMLAYHFSLSEDERAEEYLFQQYLDLVALGTVADVVPLDHNNRILVQQGLNRMRAGRTVAGIRALLELSGRQLSRTVSTDLGFVVGPRINAAGRLEDISIGIECLLTDDNSAASQYAAQLDQINKDRREIEATMREQAFSYVDALSNRRWPSCVCLYEHSWHQGVVGLIASRVRERCHRPVIAFAREAEGFLKGSMRSVAGVHARDLLEAVSTVHPGMIEKFGGHAMAAGLTIAEHQYEAFSKAVAEQLDRLYPKADFSGAIVSDGILPDDAFNLGFAKSLRDAGPWGSGFDEPMWSGDFAVVEQRTVGENHLKMRVHSADGSAVVDAIAFNQAGDAYRGIVKLAYRLDVNEFRGRETAQLIVEQISALHDSTA